MRKDQPQHTIRQSETRHGVLCHSELDEPIGRSLSMYGEWAEGELALLTRLLQPGDTVVDVGANVGTHAIAFAAAVGPHGQVLAIEPQPEVAALLRRNVEVNGTTQVTVVEGALGPEAGTATLHAPDPHRRHNSGAASLKTSADAGSSIDLEVEVRTLDSFALERCALIKIDTEGFEREVVRGAAQTLARTSPLIYAECTALGAGWALITDLERSHACWLHAPSAFNPDNFSHTRTNIFGDAQESNLLFVPLGRDAALSPMLVGAGLQPVNGLESFAELFQQVKRFDDPALSEGQIRTLSRRAHALERSLAMAMNPSPRPADGDPLRPVAPRLTRPLHVIVPIYNGYEDVERLVQSLFYSHPAPIPGLTFVFIDDASPDPRIRQMLQGERFRRDDVVVLENAQNRGFIGTVNRGFELFCFPADGTDAVILNSDTLVFGNAFAILQDVALRTPNVASVTPVSNNATIASLFGWPDGSDLPGLLEPEVVARVVENAKVRAPVVDVPTGIGFCLYMTKRALDLVGGFDPTFGKGYCEENAWCQDAAKQGLLNTITTEAFVFHRGNVSFGDETKRKQIERNLGLLHERHPRYTEDVMRHIAADPYRDSRLALQWALRSHVKRSMGLQTVLYTLHTDPKYFGGGTERHVMALTEHLLAGGMTEVFHLYPEPGGKRFVLRGYFPQALGRGTSSEIINARFDVEDLHELLAALAKEVDIFHVHHTLAWPSWFAAAVPLFERARRIITLHDYYAICPSIRLLGRSGYCGVPKDLKACNACLRDVQNYRESTIEVYRLRSRELLAQFHEIITPSEASRRVLVKGLGTIERDSHKVMSTIAAIRESPNFLSLPSDATEPRHEPARAPTGQAPRIVFLGAFSEPKGAALFSRAVIPMQQRGWQLEVWGAVGHEMEEGVVHRQYRSPEALEALGREFPVDVVVMPATWPETYSFTTLEGVLLLRAPVVVGPFGNPRELVARHRLGVALAELTEADFLQAISRCLEMRESFPQVVEHFREATRGLTVTQYVEREYGGAPVGAASEAAARLPRPAQNASLEMPQDGGNGDDPIRYRFINATNVMVKSRLPRIHAYAKRMAEWVSRRNL